MSFNRLPGEDVFLPDTDSWTVKENFELDANQNVTSTESSVTPFQVVYYVVDISLAILAIVGNLFLIIAYFTNKRLRIISHYHLISLAISDLLMGAVTIPIWLAAAFKGLPHDCYWCLMSLSTVLFVDLASVYSLLAMTIDRYLFIAKPMFYNSNVTSKRTIWWIISLWVAAGIFVIVPMPLGWKWSESQYDCNFLAVVDTQYLLFIFISSIVVPIIGMGTMYTHIFFIIRQKVRLLFMQCIITTPSMKTLLGQFFRARFDVGL